MKKISFFVTVICGVVYACSPSKQMNYPSASIVEVDNLSVGKIDSTLSEGIITGTIIDNEGIPLIGASVLLKGTTNGTITDIDGSFSLNQLPESERYLVISYTGYHTLEIFCDSLNHFDIVLNQNGGALAEVCITGYAPKKKLFKGLFKKKNKSAQSYANEVIPLLANDIKQTLDNETYDEIRENKIFLSSLNPISTFSIDVDRASYSNVRRYIEMEIHPPLDAIRIEELINYFDYNYEGPDNDLPFTIHTGLSACPWNKQHQLLSIGLQARKIDTRHLPPSNLTFLIDVSGSMGDVHKLPLVKASLKFLVDQMRQEDVISLVVYAGAAGVVLKPTSAKHKSVIYKAIDNLQSGGSTAGGAGIELAYKLAKEHYREQGNNRVILATDGDFNIGIDHPDDLVKLIESKRDDGIFLSVLGFGMGNYRDDMMQRLADNGNGNHAYVHNIEEAKKLFGSEFSGTLFTIAKDVKIQIGFNDRKVQAYRLIGYENRMLGTQDFDDDAKDAGELGVGHTVTALYEIIPHGANSDFLSENYISNAKPESEKLEPIDLDDLAVIKLRYKSPEGSKSQLQEFSISSDLTEPTEAHQFASAVAEFGLLLRDSKYMATANYDALIKRAKSAKGADIYGIKSEFIKLAQDMKKIDHSLAEK